MTTKTEGAVPGHPLTVTTTNGVQTNATYGSAWQDNNNAADIGVEVEANAGYYLTRVEFDLMTNGGNSTQSTKRALGAMSDGTDWYVGAYSDYLWGYQASDENLVTVEFVAPNNVDITKCMIGRASNNFTIGGATMPDGAGGQTVRVYAMRVWYKSAGSGEPECEWQNVTVVSSTGISATELIIDNLEPDTKYQYKVAANRNSSIADVDNSESEWKAFDTIGEEECEGNPLGAPSSINISGDNITWTAPAAPSPTPDSYSLTVCTVGSGGRTWDFTAPWSINLSTTDGNLTAATTAITGYNEGNRFNYNKALTSLSAATFANGAAIPELADLGFTIGANNLRLCYDYGAAANGTRLIMLNGSGTGAQVKIPASAGATVTVVGLSGNIAQSGRGFIDVSGGDLTSGSNINTTTGVLTDHTIPATWVFTATGDNLVIQTVSGGMCIFSITVTGTGGTSDCSKVKTGITGTSYSLATLKSDLSLTEGDYTVNVCAVKAGYETQCAATAPASFEVAGEACVPTAASAAPVITVTQIAGASADDGVGGNCSTKTNLANGTDIAVCGGVDITYAVAPNLGGSAQNAAYEWFVGAASQGAASSSATTFVRAAADTEVVSCKVHFDNNCNIAQTAATSNAVTVTTLCSPNPPTNANAMPDDEQIVLTWNASPDADIDGYRLYRDGIYIATVGKVTTYTFTGLTNGTEYDVEVRAYKMKNSYISESAAATDRATPSASSTLCTTPSATIGTPSAISVCVGATSPTIALTLPSNVTSYVWRRVASSATGTPLATDGTEVGTANTTLSISTSIAGAYKYFAVLTSSGDCTTTTAVTGLSSVVTVNATPVISGSTSVVVGSTITLSSIPTATSWNSDDTDVATVSSSGVVTGVAAGTANITATANGCISAAYEVTVTSGTEQELFTTNFATDWTNGQITSGTTSNGVTFNNSWTINNDGLLSGGGSLGGSRYVAIPVTVATAGTVRIDVEMATKADNANNAWRYIWQKEDTIGGIGNSGTLMGQANTTTGISTVSVTVNNVGKHTLYLGRNSGTYGTIKSVTITLIP
jgi:hypothetical protein